jgi:3-methyladenine DNA glycosylase AlkC
MSQSTSESTALKEMFDEARLRQIAAQTAAVYPAFDVDKFLALALADLDQLSLMQRLRRTTESLHATLPSDYHQTIAILYELAPRIQHNFVTLFLSDYVGLYGLDDFDHSLAALKYFTTFGSAEFAIREYLRRDLHRTLAVMEVWSRDENEHVRRLASEGCRPRLPWSFRLEALIADPTPVLPILENLQRDPSLYVRKSVANHLNDISKDHPAWMMEQLERWPLDDPHTAWIAKRAVRTLIKQGDARALTLIGAGGEAQVAVEAFTLQPQTVALGERISLTCQLRSTAMQPQRLVVDYIVHYIKKSGGSSGKVFKWKEFTLAPGEAVPLTRSQQIRNFSTRVHYPGRHRVEVVVNGTTVAESFFDLRR